MGTEVTEYSSVNLPYRGHTRRLREKCKDQKQKIRYCTPSNLTTFSGPTPTRTTVVSKTIFHKYRRLANDTTIVKDSPKLNTPKMEENFVGPLLYIALVTLVYILLERVPFRKSKEKGLIRACMAMTAVCMWLFWFIIYVGQLNPLIGPRLKNTTVAWIAYKIGNPA